MQFYSGPESQPPPDLAPRTMGQSNVTGLLDKALRIAHRLCAILYIQTNPARATFYIATGLDSSKSEAMKNLTNQQKKAEGLLQRD